MKSLINDLKIEFDKVINYMKIEFANIRTGRASIGLVENISVDCYDSKMPLKNVASISIPEARTILISVWDKNILKNVEKAILNSGLGLNPMVDKDIIRINIPPLTEERRKEFVKLIGKMAEERKIQIRKIREDFIKKVEQMEEKKEINEDEKFRLKENIQKVVDEYNKLIEDLTKKKEEEILTI